MTKKILVLMMFSALAFGQIPSPDFAPYKWAHVDDFISLNPPTSDVTGTLKVSRVIFVGKRQCAFIDVQTKAVTYAKGCTPDEVLLSVIDHADKYQLMMEARDRELWQSIERTMYPRKKHSAAKK